MAAQRVSIAEFASAGQVVAEFTEVESRRRQTKWPELQAALSECRKCGAILLIARLDRLAHNRAFISALMEGETDFIACDMPVASRLSINIMGAVAEHRHGMISSRIKAALAAAKYRGTKLGNPRLEEARRAALAAHRAYQATPEVLNLMAGWRQEGWTLRRIASELNLLNIRPARGRQWYASNVSNQLDRTVLSVAC